MLIGGTEEDMNENEIGTIILDSAFYIHKNLGSGLLESVYFVKRCAVVPLCEIFFGNLTSQYFANYYLSSFDHYFKENWKAKRYIRYMDDILIFGDDKNEIDDFYNKAVDYANEKLNLVLKPKIAGQTKTGAPFLGFLVKPNGICLQQKTKKRYKARIAEIEYKRKNDIINELEAGKRVQSVTAHLLIARSRNMRNNVISGQHLY